MKRAILALPVIVLATACTAAQQGTPAPEATAQLIGSDGRPVGSAHLVQAGDQVQIHLSLTDVEPGTHGIHIHETGQCDPPDFSSAGGHYSPMGRQHGFEDPAGPHAGDLPNIDVPQNRTAQVTLTNDRVSLGAGGNTLFDADGSALVVHAGADDYRTDPSGDSGSRIACGVITR